MYGAINEGNEYENLADAIRGKLNAERAKLQDVKFSPDQVFFASPSNRDFALHILRNSHGYSDDTLRDMRLKVCDELERLWRLESTTHYLIKHLAGEYKEVVHD